ncbi:MAG: hypothetical protein ACQXXH_08355 [Candidatus Bathyarchaeia archaeon]|nr:hypothetical protein [Candidatus Bathyarchaeota archaeon A05DMB-4]MDH7595990.1 hypothetical protein [Candidatus Bathyarchaeota archaeon]
MEKNTIILTTLCIILLASTSILAYSYVNSISQPKKNTSKTFTYTWTAEEQNITDSEVGLQINVTFTIEGSILRVVTIINDTETSHRLLVIAFDTNMDGEVGEHADLLAKIMYPNNWTRTGEVVPNGGPVFETMTPGEKATTFYCKFDGHKYLYNATFLLNEPNHTIYGDLFQLVYERSPNPGEAVVKVDHFDLRK